MSGDLHDRLMLEGADLLVDTIDNIGQGKVTGTPQAELMTEKIKEAPKIFKDTCRIDWNKSNSEVHNHIRGLSPYPAAWSALMDSDGKELGLKLFKTIKTESNLTPGIIKTDGKGAYWRLDVALEVYKYSNYNLLEKNGWTLNPF